MHLLYNWFDENRFVEDKGKHFCRYAPADDMERGQSQFAALKLRSLALVPSSGALPRPSELFYVNTATGEKSGDVLAQAKLTSE